MRKASWWLLASVLAAACGASHHAELVTITAPDPTGCFIQIFSEAEFQGAREFVNGPRKYTTLGDMPGRVSWNNRIKSLRVGPAITQVVLWTDQLFAGSRLRLGPDRSMPRLAAELSAAAESLEIDCAAQPLPTLIPTH